MDEQLVKHILDIKMAQVKTQEQIAAMRKELYDHNESTKQTRKELGAVEKEVAEAKIVLRTLRWVVALAFITIPAIAAAVAKIYNSFI